MYLCAFFASVCVSVRSRACISVIPRRHQAGVGGLNKVSCLSSHICMHVGVIRCDMRVCLCLIVWKASQLVKFSACVCVHARIRVECGLFLAFIYEGKMQRAKGG